MLSEQISNIKYRAVNVKLRKTETRVVLWKYNNNNNNNNNVFYLSVLKEEQEIFMKNHRHFHSVDFRPFSIRSVHVFNIQDCGFREASR